MKVLDKVARFITRRKKMTFDELNDSFLAEIGRAHV